MRRETPRQAARSRPSVRLDADSASVPVEGGANPPRKGETRATKPWRRRRVRSPGGGAGKRAVRAASRSTPFGCPVATATWVDRQTESTLEWNETARAPARRDEGPSARRAMPEEDAAPRPRSRNRAAPPRPSSPSRGRGGRRARRPSWNTVRGVRRGDGSEGARPPRTERRRHRAHDVGTPRGSPSPVELRLPGRVGPSRLADTRKVTIYSRSEGSPGKPGRTLWGVLTCKSLPRSGRSGERPIESPGSWFRRKCPPGQRESRVVGRTT